MLERGDDILREDDPTDGVNVIMVGLGYRHKSLADGRRQILAFMTAGDFCDLHAHVIRRMDHSIGVLTQARVAHIRQDVLNDLLDAYPRLARAFWWPQLMEVAILRERILNVGRRTAYERAAHLLCELFYKLRAAGLTRG